ncbi:death-inducer obliterator 1 isoform X2 [Pectinophora gossypiella]|uniref:death-inducer obliterator 1 isoform X2 n=1 Tax=Pectinophora gossypiella TaxID=13191 RepID=UPI00214E3268|nr:death-inducer obliterator 1 isoform X2 [Pectinophora gossypiella]
MSNTVITNYTDLNGPSTKADSSVVVIVNKDGSLSVDQNLLGTLMGTDGSQSAGISVVRVGHEGRPDDATDSESDDDKVPHVTLSVDSYYDEPNSIIKYDSGAEMLQSLRIETRENSLVGFQNDHCYTPLTSPSQGVPQRSDSFSGYDEPILEITHTPPPKPVPQSKKITILEQQILPKGKKIIINPSESSVLLKGNDILNKPLPVSGKSKLLSDVDKSSENSESSSISSGDSIPDRDSDSDYKDTKDRSLRSVRKSKLKPRILKNVTTGKGAKLDTKVVSRLKSNKNILKKDIKEKIHSKAITERKQSESDLGIFKENLTGDLPTPTPGTVEVGKVVSKQTPKPVKKEKKTPAHVTALLSDMTSLFSTPDVIRRVSTDGKVPAKPEKEPSPAKKIVSLLKTQEPSDAKLPENQKALDSASKGKNIQQKTYAKQKEKVMPADKVAKGYDLIPQLDDASLAQILQDTTGMSSTSAKVQPNITTANTMNSPGLAGPLSPTLDLLGGLQPEEEGLTEDLLMHVAQLVESSENLQEVIDKQVLGKVDTVPAKAPLQSPFQQAQTAMYAQTPTRAVKTVVPRKDPIEIVRRDGRVITLPPIEAPATRSSKRKSQMDTTGTADALTTPTAAPVHTVSVTPEPQVQQVSKQYVNKKTPAKKQEQVVQSPVVEKLSAESQESWNSEDDPNRLWCICKQPHNNRFMICCDGCEDWFHGKCVNITKAMGQQMEERGIEWRCPNCVKKTKATPKSQNKATPQRKSESEDVHPPIPTPGLIPKDGGSKTGCIVCKRPARASSIYCSDACILKHAQDSLGTPPGPSKAEIVPGKSQEKPKSDSRVIVYERKTGRLLAGPNAPTAENLKTWLQKNPTFEVVRPGTLHTIKPNVMKKKSVTEANKVQTTLNFERIPRKSAEQPGLVKTPQSEAKERPKILSPKVEVKGPPQARTPVATRSQPPQYQDTPRPSTSKMSEPKKPVRALNRSQSSTHDKVPSVSPSTSRRKEAPESRKRMDSTEPIRENVRKSLQEQMSIRMTENKGRKFTEEEIHQFAVDTEEELHELFSRDVGMKYKAKYRSLMFNIKDRKNLTLWQKICDRKITPQQLVRLSPEELASQELAQWREEEAKHQLELIKKSELDLLAANKTYVLKTHKGEEVMETKESVQTELDPEVPVEDLVSALNDSTVGDETPVDISQEKPESLSKPESKHGSSRKRDRENSSSGRSKKSSRESKRDSDNKKSRSSRRRSDGKDREERSMRRSDKKSSRARSLSKERPKTESKEKSDSSERSRRRSRSRSRAKSKKRSKSREHSRSTSQGRERSSSRDRTRKQSPSREIKRRRSSRTKHSSSTEGKQRSRSQENVDMKSKNDSTDSDSIERPKSAMLKEIHPEYDPHEPMITSAFSEEDLRKSGGESYEDTYKSEVVEDFDASYDPAKPFSIDTSVILPSTKFTGRQEKVSEAESDQEPSSTVENSAVTVWNGCINMVDVARFYVAAHEVSGHASDLEEDLSPELDIVGRINPDTVWDYIGKMKRASNKDIIILRMQAANDEEKMQYIALYSYLSSRNRLGVVKVSNTTAVKDFYIVPLPANTALPSVLLPLDGPGLGEVKTHLLLAIVIRQRKKRQASHIPKDIVPAKVARGNRKRSYTPPVVPRSATPPSARLPLPTYTSPALSTSVKDKIAASLAAADDEEAYSPGSSSSSGSLPAASSGGPAPAVATATAPSDKLRSKMEELNRQIEEQKQQILKMAQADSSVGEDEEAYSPSRPMTPPSVVPLADIALPSNLQEILATIKQRSETTTGDVDMRNLPLPP